MADHDPPADPFRRPDGTSGERSTQGEIPGASANSTAEAMRSFGTLGSVGFAFVIAIVLGAGGGLLIDRWIGRDHWGFFVGFFLGLAAGIVTVVRASKSIR